MDMRISSFAASDSGAVTVDWVVLTSGLVGLGLATAGVVSSGVENLSGDIRNALANIAVASVQEEEAELGWGDLSMFVWSDQGAAEQHMQGLLQYVYNNDAQALYDDVVNDLNTAFANNDLDSAQYNADRLGYLQDYATNNNIQFSGDNQPSYSDVHARVTAMTPT
ncbi:hypothetical protein HKCCSP123_02990 [Rhodobacterales bacterium HKCCSP123]|nr:hypothetical protein [Rhodobacterales bacterium HKCCSP123]